MAKIPLYTIDVPAPRSLAERAAEIARPGPGGRHVGNHWGLNRKPWAHQFIPGLGSLRYDTDPVEKQQLERVAIAVGTDPVTAAAMSLDELLVIPEIAEQISAGATAAQVQFPPGTSAAGTPVPTSTQYEPSGITSAFSDTYVRSSGQAIFSRSGPSVTAPVIVRSIAIWSKSDLGANDGSLVLSIAGTGIAIELAGNFDVSVNAGFSTPINAWVLTGQAGINWQGRGVSPVEMTYNAIVTYEKLRRVSA